MASEGITLEDLGIDGENPFEGLGELLGLFDVTVDEDGVVTITFEATGHVCLVFTTDDGAISIRCTTDGQFNQTERSLTIPATADGVLGLLQAGGSALRIADNDRIGTAIAASLSGWDTAADMVLADAGNFADALAGAPLAGQLDAPLLITDTDSLDARVLDEITRLGASTVTVLGGTAAISDTVTDALEAAGLTVTRLAGADRTGTAEAIAAALDDSAEGVGIIAAGRSFADALSVAPIAAQRGLPIYLTAGDALTASTIEALGTDGITQVVIVGGIAVVPQAVEDQLAEAGVTVAQRLAGPTRYETATAVLDHAASTGTDTTELLVATGENFPDALAAGAYGARTGRAVLLVNGGGDLAGQPAEAYLAGADPQLLVLLGGDAVISEALRSALQATL